MLLAFRLTDTVAEWPEVALVVGVAVIAAWIVSRLLGRLADWLLAGALGAADPAIARSLVGRPLLLIRFLAATLTFVAVLLPLLEAIGLPLATTAAADRDSLRRWLFGSGLRIAVVLLVAWFIVRIAAVSTRRLEHELSQGGGLDVIDRTKRAQTLGRLVQNVLTVVVTAIALLMVLRELGVDIMPMLTGAGIAGVALGFGAQWLVRDVIAGFFLILEDHVRVGDVAAINGIGGVVEAINLRTIVLRDQEGTIHVFQNGGINTLANRTKDYAYAVLDVSVAYKQDTDRVAELLRAVGDDLRQDPTFKAITLEPLEVLGVDAFFDNKVTVKARIKTLPQKQWDVARELRRRVRAALDKESILLPPQSMPLTVVDARESPADQKPDIKG